MTLRKRRIVPDLLAEIFTAPRRSGYMKADYVEGRDHRSRSFDSPMQESTMQLFATPLSHYSRKVRILLDHCDLAYELIDVGNVANADAAAFQDNPLMKVPVLKDGDLWLIESDHIAAYLVRKHDPQDRYRVLTADPSVLNARAVLNGIMADEVKIILAERTGLDTKPHAFFRKAQASIENSLRWLEDRTATFDPQRPGYLEFHLVCLWDHLKHYNLFHLDYPVLESIVTKLSSEERIRRTAPQRKAPPPIRSDRQ